MGDVGVCRVGCRGLGCDDGDVVDEAATPTDQPKRVYRGTRPGGRSARVREAVFAATFAELGAVGYDGLTLARVAERAEVALSTVHRRWGTKARLLADAIGELTATQVPDPMAGDVRRDLLILARSVAEMLSQPLTRQVLRTAFALPDDELDVLRQAHWGSRYDVAQAVIDRAVSRGELPDDTDGWAVVEPIHARIWMRLLITGLPIDDALLERIVDQVLSAARRGELA
jgi:AcrR family transcriptional regulator